MKRQYIFLEKKRVGRPPTGQGHQVNIMVRDSMLDAIDAYCHQMGLKRTDGVRNLIKLGIKAYNMGLDEQADR